MYKFLFLITFIILHQDIAKAKKPDPNNFNQKYLSNYFSAIISTKNQNDLKAISYFNNSKKIIKILKKPARICGNYQNFKIMILIKSLSRKL